MRRITDLPTLIRPPEEVGSYEDRIAKLAKELVEAMDAPTDLPPNPEHPTRAADIVQGQLSAKL